MSEPGSTRKCFWRGTHRCRQPDETLAQIQPFLREMGITRVADVTGMDNIGIPTVMVTRPNSRSLAVSQGKGLDLDSAKASGVMESVESYHAEAIARPLRLMSARELHSEVDLIDVDRLPRFVASYTPEQRISWIEGRELGGAAPVWVPYEAVHLDLTLPLPSGSGFFVSGSSGLASGNHPLEATAHGLYELVERDAATLFFLRTPDAQWQRRLDLDSVDDTACCELLDRYRRARVGVAVWDVTSDARIPAFLCSILDEDRNSFRPVGVARGWGCHPERGIALSRALTEAAQSRLTRIVGSRDDIQQHDFAALRTRAAADRCRAEMHLPARAPRAFGEVPSCRFDTFEEELGWAGERLAAIGAGPAVVVDLSRPRYGVSVVRVLVPGLEALSELPGYHPGPRALTLEKAEAP